MSNSKLSKEFETYRVFIKDDEIEISDMADFTDMKCKNFEILVQSIGLRANPISISEVKKVRSVKEYGSTEFVGLGFVWDFAVETVDAFYDDGDDVKLLRNELHGIVLPNGKSLSTKGDTINTEFIKGEFYEDIGDST